MHNFTPTIPQHCTLHVCYFKVMLLYRFLTKRLHFYTKFLADLGLQFAFIVPKKYELVLL